jgi:hypothetical protein
VKITSEQKRKIPWFMHRNRCARCSGYHAPWWGTVRAPSCEEGSARVNDMTMALESLKVKENR